MSRPSMPPGFRFYPTDEELIVHYLRHRASSLPCPVSIIAEVDIYKFDPWDLPARAMFGDREWYFFSPRDRKYPNGARPNRAAASGYWKATGTDKMIVSSSGKEKLGVKKALVFYKGKPPKGQKTNWIMHEYRLAESLDKNKIRPLRVRDSSMRLDDWVLCRIYAKSSHLPSTTPVLDQEQESSIVEDLSSSTLANSAPPNALKPENKSFSFSDLLKDVDYSTLSQLLDMDPVNKSSITANINSSGSSSNNNNKWNSNTIQQLHQTESPVPGYSLSSQVYSPQCNLLLNHQFLIGSHLTFQ